MNHASERMTKNERRAQAREQARIAREEAKRRERRNRILAQGGIILGVLAIVAIVAVIIVVSVKPAGPGPANMASDGVVLQPGDEPGTMEVVRSAAQASDASPTPAPTADGLLDIVVYVDYLCPYCGQFETTNGDYLKALVAGSDDQTGSAQLTIKPAAFLDAQSAGTNYSTRAMNAVACVVDSEPDSFYDFQTLLFQNQPAEGGAGLTDDELIDFAAQAGADNDEVATCIRDQSFADWTEAATDRARTEITGTPTILVNGVQYTGSLTDTTTFRQFVLEQRGLGTMTTEPTPTPTPTAESGS